jgi:hypothetical protein
VLVLIALGGWLIALSDDEFSWGDGWVLTSVVTLVVMEGYGGIVLAPNGKRLHAMLETVPDGPVPAEIDAAVRNPLVWAGAWGETGLATAILFLMPTKPTGVWSVLIVVVLGSISAAAGYRLSGAAVDRAGAARSLA